MAVVLAGVHLGLTQGLAPTPPSTGNAGSGVGPAMPLNLWQALDRIEGSQVLADYLGPRHPVAHAAIKRTGSRPSWPRFCRANTRGI